MERSYEARMAALQAVTVTHTNYASAGKTSSGRRTGHDE